VSDLLLVRSSPKHKRRRTPDYFVAMRLYPVPTSAVDVRDGEVLSRLNPFR
jgi:hypothetical protein